MATSFDVAKAFIELAAHQAKAERGDAMTNMRLNKLLYFAQGHCLAKYDRSLFDDAIEAWPKGPVVPSVYEKYKTFGWNPIVEDPADRSNLTPEEINLILDVFDEYKEFSTYALVDKTHEDNGPWKQFFHGRPYSVIDLDVIKAYFKTQPHRSLSDEFSRKVKQLAVIPKYKNGVAVLPKEWVHE